VQGLGESGELVICAYDRDSNGPAPFTSVSVRLSRSYDEVVKKVIEWVQRQKPFRVYTSYSLAGGNLSAAGMSFQSFFAVFAAVWVSFSISGLYLNAHPDVRKAVIDFINLQVPHLISTGGAIDPSLLSDTTFGWTGALATVVLAFTAINWIQYTRVAMHHMFGLPTPALNFLLLKLWDLVIALLYGLAIFIGASVTVFATNHFADALDWLGIDSTSALWLEYAVRFVIIVLVFVIDPVGLAIIIRVLSGVKIPYRYLWRGALLGGLALTAMKLAGSELLGGASKNPLFASFAVFIGILIWFNLMCRVYLLTAQWIATSMRDDGVEPVDSGWLVTREVLTKPFARLKRN
jgi:membrane protein